MHSPLNIAHRGGADLWPENTLEAFARASELGADGIEFDLQLSRDAKLVIHHDPQLKPAATQYEGVFLTPPTPRIDTLSYAELQNYHIGMLDPQSPYGEKRKGRENMANLTMPDFDALCDLVRAQASADFHLYAELKTELLTDNKQAEAIAARFIEALGRHKDLFAQIIVMSFDWRTLNAIRAVYPMIAHAYLTLPFAITDPTQAISNANKNTQRLRAGAQNSAPWWNNIDWRRQPGDTHGEKIIHAIHAAGGRGWSAYYKDITPTLCALAKSLDMRIAAWTVNEAEDMRRLADLGTDAIITDRPDIFQHSFS